MKKFIALSILLAFTSLEIVDCAFLSLGNEIGIELSKGETDSSEKESECENHEKKIDEKIITSSNFEMNHSLQTKKYKLDKGLLQREIFKEIISPPPEL